MEKMKSRNLHLFNTGLSGVPARPAPKRTKNRNQGFLLPPLGPWAPPRPLPTQLRPPHLSSNNVISTVPREWGLKVAPPQKPLIHHQGQATGSGWWYKRGTSQGHREWGPRTQRVHTLNEQSEGPTLCPSTWQRTPEAVLPPQWSRGRDNIQVHSFTIIPSACGKELPWSLFIEQ